MKEVFKIFVEGVADKRFIEQLLLHIWGVTVDENCVISTGGYTNLLGKKTMGAYVNQMKMTTDDGGVNLVIFDADEDCEARRNEILDWGVSNGVSFELFMLPDDTCGGALEELLEGAINPANRPIMDCWNGYENALKQVELPWRGGVPLTTPARKTRIYAYLEALLGSSKSEKEKIKEKNRDYTDKNHWDLDAPALARLKDFLTVNLS